MPTLLAGLILISSSIMDGSVSSPDLYLTQQFNPRLDPVNSLSAGFASELFKSFGVVSAG